MGIERTRTFIMWVVGLIGVVAIAAFCVFAFTSNCAQRAEPRTSTLGTLAGDQGTVSALDEFGLRMGIAAVRCENGVAVGEIALDLMNEPESQEFTVRAGDIVTFAGFKLFASSVSCSWGTGGSVAVLVLSD